MDQKTRLAYYKALKAQNIALTAGQESDYTAIVKERGEASVEAMALGSELYEEAKRTL